jgi:ribosome biogenesis GTPase A
MLAPIRWLRGPLITFAVFTSGDGAPDKLVVGLVGYPNVGKSSTINALIGEKKVSVSSTPGKTKHFQTIHLSDIVLCDCPGLVFPQFATTKADLVCDGVLPIDQLREHTAPVALLVKRIPKPILEATYGITMKTRDVSEGEGDQVMPEDLLVPYASKSPTSPLDNVPYLPHSCSRFHEGWPREPRRSTCRTLSPQGLRERQAPLLPSSAW